MSCCSIEAIDIVGAIKSGINDYFRDCEIEKYTPHFTKSEVFDEIMTNHSLQEVRDCYSLKNNEIPTYSDISGYAYDICYYY